MQPIELTITSSVQDRVDVAAILIKNGYRVCQKTCKSNGKSRTVLVIDKVEEVGSREVPRTES